MPEDDGISDDEFDGYLDADDDVGLDDDDAGADPRDADHGVSGSPIPDFEHKGVDNVGLGGLKPPQIFCIRMLSMWIYLQSPPPPDFFAS